MRETHGSLFHRIEFICSRLSNFSAHISGGPDRLVGRGVFGSRSGCSHVSARRSHGNPADRVTQKATPRASWVTYYQASWVGVTSVTSN